MNSESSNRFSKFSKIWRYFLLGWDLWFSSEPKVGKTAHVAELVILVLLLFYPLVAVLPLVIVIVKDVTDAIAFFTDGFFMGFIYNLPPRGQV